MKAVQVAQYGGPDVIQLVDTGCPETGAGQIRVRIKGAGVGPWDAWIREGKSGVPQTLPLTLGSDIAGTVDEVGAGASGFSIGDGVYGLTNGHFTGGYAEYALASAQSMAPKPKTLSFIEASSAPVVAVTAWQMLFDYAHAAPGQKVLILGAAGNVGAYAVQMARNAGLEVSATCSSADLSYVQELGADRVIDYHQTRFEEIAQAFDIVLDTVGGDTRERLLSLLKPGGIVVSSVSPPTPSELASKVKVIFFIVDVTSERLKDIAQLFDDQKILPHVGTVLPLKDARLAHKMLAGAPHARGKIVLDTML